MSVALFMAQPAHWRIVADLLLLSVSAGLYSVPLYALIQLRSPASHRARIIAANNILNALYMVVSALLVGGLLSMGLALPAVFGLLGLANAAVTLLMFLRVPDYLGQCRAWLHTRGTGSRRPPT